MHRLTVAAVIAAALSFGSLRLRAQATASATLVGTITDKSQAVVPGAEVKISSRETGLTRTVVSNDSGQYRFDLVPAGRYEVRVSMRGFATAAFENVELVVGQTTNLSATLSPSSQAETVTVESLGAPLVDTQKTDVSLPITPSQVQELPLNGRDFANLAWLAPGARPVNSYDPTKNRIAVFGINGSNGRNVNVTVNGVDNKDNTVGGPVMQLPLEAVQEFNISTQRFSAANGRSEGAAVNVITKSGTNQYHGSLYFFDRDQALNTVDYFTAQKGQEKPPFSRQQFGGAIGGPVRKDKDFLFFALERSREQTSVVETPLAQQQLALAVPIGAQPPGATIATPYFDWRYTGRLDHRFNDANSLFLTYNNQNNIGQNDQSNGNNDKQSFNFTTNQLILANATVNSVLSPSIVNAFTAGYQYWHNVIDGPQHPPTVNFPQGIYFGNNGNVPQFSIQRKWQFRDDLSITKGAHSLKTGLDFVHQPTLGGAIGFPNRSVTFIDLPSVILSDPVKYPQGFATPGALQSMSVSAGDGGFLIPNGAKMFGVYFQDDWKIRRNLTVSLGLRWDRDFDLGGLSAQKSNRTYLALKGINSPYAGALPHDDTKDFSPRIGIAWDLFGTGKHTVRAGYGIYYGQTFINITLGMLRQSNPTIYSTTLSLTSTGPDDTKASIVPSTGKPLSQFRYGVDPFPAQPPPPTALAAGASGSMIDPFYHNPYTQQFNIGYAFQLASDSVIELEYVHTLELRESKTTNINPVRVNLPGSPRDFDAAFAAAGLPKLGPITDAESIGRSRYDGLNLSYRKRLSRKFSINSSYVLSRGLAYQNSAGSFGGTATDLNNIFAAHDFGSVPNDERHRVVASGVVDLRWGIRLAPIMQWASARPYTATQGISDVFGFSSAGTTHAIVQTGSPSSLLATKDWTATQLRDCINAGNCVQVGYDNMRGQPFFQLDLRASKTVKFGERARLELIFQAFDLTNRANFGANYIGNIKTPGFGTPQGYITPSGLIVPRSFSGEFAAQFRF